MVRNVKKDDKKTPSIPISTVDLMIAKMIYDCAKDIGEEFDLSPSQVAVHLHQNAKALVLLEDYMRAQGDD